jgi:hypothetical protein
MIVDIQLGCHPDRLRQGAGMRDRFRVRTMH